MRSLVPRTIQARLVLSHMLVSLISIALISVYAGRVLNNSVRSQVEQQYKDQAFAVANALEQPLLDLLSGQADSVSIRSSTHPELDGVQGVHYTVYLPDGQPVFDSSGALPQVATRESLPELWDALEKQPGSSEFYQQRAGSDTAYLVVGIEHDNQLLGVLHFEVPLAEALNAGRGTLGLLIVMALLLALGMSLLGFFLAKSLADPIEKLTRTAESLEQGDMTARVLPLPVPHELRRLAEAFNSMAGQLEGHVAELRGFVANASHELRTPLTSIKLRVEALREGAVEDPVISAKFLGEIESEVDRLSKMVNDLLDLSRIEAGLEASKRTTVDLSTIADEVYEAFEVRAERAGIQLMAKIARNLAPISGNEDQIRRVLFNLVDNALKYTPHGGQVEISLRSGDHPGVLYLSVRDSGFGIAAAQLPHIFERFYRVEATRPRYGPSQGSGLGLPIAKSIVETHGGRIGVTSQVGKGSTFWIELPTLKKAAS